MITKIKSKEIVGTSFHGDTVRATYAQLRTLFGEPSFVDGDKSHAEWFLSMDGCIFTVYDWKESTSPYHLPGHFYEWHIGAFTKASSARATAALNVILGGGK
jgi:hypothetical protein